ncbi:unnamed protein product [Urochloa decumbens]|uniref:Membrane-associated kinase regulator 2 n=1 Tax=Urochloa decumbens TaxID=240449 RepID=A0ABC8VQM4_9POAL
MQLQVLRLLAARRAVSTTITAPAAPAASEAPDSDVEAEEDEGPFFDLDFSASSVRASSSSAGSASSGSGSDSDDAFTDLDFIISLHRSRSASPSYDALFYAAGLAPPPPPPPPLPLLKFFPSEPSAKSDGKRGGGGLRTLSFGARKAAFYGGRPSFARSSSSARSLRLFMESPADDEGEEDEIAEEPEARRAPSRDVIRRYLTKISRRLRSVRPRAAEAGAGEARGLRRLRKSRSASAAVALAPAAPSRRDDSLAEKQDGIASAIAHCKESLHRASLSECDSPLLRSRSDPGKCEATA